jgi:hypothetical protein
MCLLEYRRLASEYRRLALSTSADDKEALELFAIGWDKIADNHEAMLHNSRPTRLSSLGGHPPGPIFLAGSRAVEI